MGNGDAFVGDNGNRETHDGKLLSISPAINGIDITLEAIVTVVKVRNDQVETFDHGLADGVDFVRAAHEHESISADMTDKALRPGEFSDHRRENAARHDKNLITTAVSVPVVKRFEIVDIDIGKCEGLSALDPGNGFQQDRRVAWEASERIGIERTGKAAKTEAHTMGSCVT